MTSRALEVTMDALLSGVKVKTVNATANRREALPALAPQARLHVIVTLGVAQRATAKVSIQHWSPRSLSLYA